MNEYNVNKKHNWIAWRNKYRFYISLVLLVIPLLNASFRFWGEWEYFFAAILVHFLFWQAINSWLYDKYMSMGGGGAGFEDGKLARLFLTGFCIVGYIVVFFFDGYPG